MVRVPGDIFAEPDDIESRHALANLGPLRGLAGVWRSAAGDDTAPKAAGPERKPFLEQAEEMQPSIRRRMAQPLLRAALPHPHHDAEGEAITFHDQTGYWLWEPATGLVLQTLAIRAAR
ncbi:MAG: hypothetical protein U1E17_06910 [Geminicoccaceae bacterium]